MARQRHVLRAPRGANCGDDVTVAFDQHGEGYVAAMMTRCTAAGFSQSDRGVYVWRTHDGGRTFTAPVAVVRHRFVDHPSIAVGTGAAGQVPVYVVWVTSDHVGLGFGKSTDSGRTFAAPRTVSAPPGGVSAPVVAAGPDGAVYASFLASRRGLDPDEAPASARSPGRGAHGRRDPAAPTERGVTVDVVASSDGGAHFSPARTLAHSPNNLTPAADVSLPTAPSVTVDPHSGTVYVAYVAPSGSGMTSNVLLARSASHGRTWQPSRTVAAGASAGQAVYFQPNVVVDSASGIDMCFLALSHGTVNTELTRSTTRGEGFPAPITVTESPFKPGLGLHSSKHGAWWIGDYQGLAAGAGVVYPVWNDTRTGQLEIFAASVAITELG